MTEIKEAVELYEYAAMADQENREQALEDLRFRVGKQWDQKAVDEREKAGRPVLTINRIPQFIRQVVNEARQNPPSITVLPVGDEDQKQADIRSGIIRHIEHRSKARDAYITALDGSATCGIGNIRVLTEWSELDPLVQEIRIDAIRDHVSVIYDPDARRLTKEDGGFAFVTGLMSNAKFKRKYPKAKVVEFNRDTVGSAAIWGGRQDSVRVAEMFDRKEMPRKVLILRDGSFIDAPESRNDIPPETQMMIAAERTITNYRVCRYVLTAQEVIEEETDFPSKFIPLIPVVGDVVHVGEDIVRHGLTRFMRDPARLYNYWRTAAAEQVALAPKAPFLATANQIGPYRELWDNANRTTSPYLLYGHDDKAPGPPIRATQPEPPAAMWQEGQIAQDDMKGVTGIYDAALGAQGNEVSGKAIIARQREGDIGTFHYIDNMRLAVERVGFTILDMIPRIYDTERTIQIVEHNDETKPITVNKATVDGIENDMSVGVYDLRVTTGPSYTTQRIETAEKVIQLVQAIPQVGQVGADILVKNMDFPGSEVLEERLKLLLPPQMQTDDDGNPIPVPPQQPNPMQEAEAREAVAKAAKAEAETEGQTLENIAKRTELGV